MNNKTWIQTDGSCSTLQYGKKIDEYTWKYRQWVDAPFDKKFTCEKKISLWNHHLWKEESINLKNYTVNEINDHVATYGYSVAGWSEDLQQFRLQISNNEPMSLDDSVQIACECIFENIV